MKSAFRGRDHRHCETVAREIPLVGFLSAARRRRRDPQLGFLAAVAAIDNVIAIKMAPFNRYRTLDVAARGLRRGRAGPGDALYRQRRPHPARPDLPFDLRDPGVNTRVHIKGGLLGHWSVWTAAPSKQFEMCRAAQSKGAVSDDLLALDARVTDCKQRVLRRRQQFSRLHRRLPRSPATTRTARGDLVPRPRRGPEPRPSREIDRVSREHKDLCDDAFVAANLARWLA